MKIAFRAILLSGATAFSQAATPCILGGGWSFRTESNYNVDDEDAKANDVQCSYDVLLAAFTEKTFNDIVLQDESCTNTAEEEFLALLGVDTAEEGADEVYKICGDAQEKMRKIPLSDVTYEQGSQFIEIYYSGRSAWNEETETLLYPSDGETPFNKLKEDAQLVDSYYEHSQKAAFEMPDLEQFKPELCTANAAMCCWPRDRQAGDNNGNCNTEYDENCIDKDVADNTDLCYVELTHAPYANGIDASGLSLFPGDNNNGEGAIHCHGFAWANDDQEITSRYKANNLFYVSMYDHMYQRGYVENIPGAPMCGCVEHMPVVSRSDCTQTNLDEYYTFTKKAGDSSFIGKVDRIKLAYQACQGAANTNNDLTAFVQQLVNDGKLTTAEQDIYSKRVVGNHQCNNAIEEALDSHNFEKGYDIDESKWTFITGENFPDEEPLYDARMFKAMVEEQDPSFRIVRRVCPSCDDSHKDIYYKRLTDMPEDFDLLDTLMSNWVNTDNDFNVDFALYSTYMDAYYDVNRWTFCNFASDVGFPRDCGPNGRVNNNWNSYRHGGGRANYHAFLIPTESLESFDNSTVINIASYGTASQSSTAHSGVASRAVDGVTVGLYHNGFNSVTHTHTQSNPWWQLDFDYEVTFNKVHFWNRIDCCESRLDGAIVSVIDKYTEEEVASVTIGTAKVMNVVDFGEDGFVGHALRISLPGDSRILSLAEVQVEGSIGDPVTGNIKVDYFEHPGWSTLGDLRNMDGSYKSDDLWKINFPSTGGNFATSGRSDRVAALFKGFIDFEEEGTYELCVDSDDGSKLYVKGDLLVNNDGLHGMVNKCGSFDQKGIFSVWVEFFETGGGAGLIVTWKPPSATEFTVIPPSAWVDADILPPTASPTASPTHDYAVRAKYYAIPGWSSLPAAGFNDEGLDGITLVNTERIQYIDIAAGGGVFGGSGRADRVGATFEGKLDFDVPGSYKLCVTSDDGSKLYVDGELKINNDGLHGDVRRCFDATYEVGTHMVFVEFFENGGGATCKVSWQKPGASSIDIIPGDSWLPFD